MYVTVAHQDDDDEVGAVRVSHERRQERGRHQCFDEVRPAQQHDGHRAVGVLTRHAFDVKAHSGIQPTSTNPLKV